jgi:DNA replication protein DnaC
VDKKSERILRNLIATSEAEQKKIEALPGNIKQQFREKEEAKKRAELIQFCRRRGIPPRFYGVSWGGWVSDTEDKHKAFQTVKNKAWITNLFLCGKSGAGKTHLAMCLRQKTARSTGGCLMFSGRSEQILIPSRKL